MNTVIVVGDSDISGLLSGEVFPRCEVVITDSAREINARDSVVVAGHVTVLPERVTAFAAVVDADADIDLSALRGNSVITCGIGCRNTVSVTSKTADRITLSLNRAVHTVKGLCEPLELPVPLYESYTDFDYMAAFAVSVIFGNV